MNDSRVSGGQSLQWMRGEDIEFAVQGCLISSSEKLTIEKIELVLKALRAYALQNIVDQYPGYTRKMLIAAQRAWYLIPSQRTAIEKILCWDIFDRFRPNDVKVIASCEEGTKEILANSLLLVQMSEHFKNAFKSTFQEGNTLHSEWSTSRVRGQWNIALSKPFLQLPVEVSAVAIETLLRRSKPEATMDLVEDLLYLQPTPLLEANGFNNKVLVAQFTSKLTGDNVLESYVQAMQLDPVNESSHLSYFKDCCARLLIEGITSLKEWEEVVKALPVGPEDLLSRGLQRALDQLHHQDRADEELFATLTNGPLEGSGLTREICADLLVSRLPQHLKNLPVPQSKSKHGGLVDRLKKSLKTAKSRDQAASSSSSSLIDPENSKAWLERFETIVSQIDRYDHLTIRGLAPEQLNWLLDHIAPFAKELNLSGFEEEDDAILWTRAFPNLVELKMTRCPQLAVFSGTNVQLPTLRRVDFSENPKMQMIARKSGLQLTHLDVHHCPEWQDYLGLVTRTEWLQWMNVVGCDKVFVRCVHEAAEDLPALMVIADSLGGY